MCALAPLQLDAYSNRSRLAQVLQHEVPQQSDLFGTQLVLHIRKFQKLLACDACSEKTPMSGPRPFQPNHAVRLAVCHEERRRGGGSKATSCVCIQTAVFRQEGAQTCYHAQPSCITSHSIGYMQR
mmetsp:Transcript_63370/g.88117  ORF Transcript_63370/g.88117 Transcript_63370/m.88117 type:complete len:126 (+) Transcript_63370:162-539(+)